MDIQDNPFRKKLKSSYYGYSPHKFLLMVTEYMNGPIRPLNVKGPLNPRVKTTFRGLHLKKGIPSIARNINSYMRRYLRAPPLHKAR